MYYQQQPIVRPSYQPQRMVHQQPLRPQFSQCGYNPIASYAPLSYAPAAYAPAVQQPYYYQPQQPYYQQPYLQQPYYQQPFYPQSYSQPRSYYPQTYMPSAPVSMMSPPVSPQAMRYSIHPNQAMTGPVMSPPRQQTQQVQPPKPQQPQNKQQPQPPQPKEKPAVAPNQQKPAENKKPEPQLPTGKPAIKEPQRDEDPKVQTNQTQEDQLEDLALQYEDGFIYRGQGVPPQTRHGFGVLTDPNEQEVYAGFWKDNYYHGEGRLTNLESEEGDDQQVNWQDLTSIANSWQQYEGEFSEGKMHGKGALKFKSGERYEGDFNDGTIHGNGVFFTASEEIEGTWNQGQVVDFEKSHSQ